MFNGVQSGRVGSIVGFKRDDAAAPQGIRPYVAPSNPKTVDQSKQRSNFAGVAVLMSILSQIADHNMEGVKVGRWNRRAFSRYLFADKQCTLIAAKGASAVALADGSDATRAVRISKGTLGLCTPTTAVSITALGTLTEEKIAAAGLQVGDIITILLPRIQNGLMTGIAYGQYQVEVGTEITELELAYDNGTYNAKMVADCFGVIIERNGASKHLLTTSVVAKMPVFSAQLTDDCYSTYQGSEKVLKDNEFLYGEQFSENPKPAVVVGMRNLTINGSSLNVGGSRQMLTTAALSGSVVVTNLESEQIATAVIGNFMAGEDVSLETPIGTASGDNLTFTHDAFGSAGTRHIWLALDGVAYRKIADLNVVEPPFETTISALSLDGNSVVKNTQVQVEGATASLTATITAYASGHSIGIGFSPSNMVTASGTSISGTLNGVTNTYQTLKLFVDGVAVEDWCQVKNNITPITGFGNVTIGGQGWNQNITKIGGSTFAVAGSYVGEGDKVGIVYAESAPSVGESVLQIDGAIGDVVSNAFSGNPYLGVNKVGYLVAYVEDASNDTYIVKDVYQYHVTLSGGDE